MNISELQQRIAQWENLHTEFYYDETPLYRASLSDLNGREIANFFEMAYKGIENLAFERTLLNIKLAQEVKNNVQPTLAGMLFFGNQPQQFVPYAYITALRIPGRSLDIPPSDRKKIEGPLPAMLEEAVRFLYIHLPISHHIHKLDPEAQIEFPDVVLRELLVNALAHRDYTVEGPVRLFIFDDRVEIRSPGQLPNSITLDSMRLGVHVLRNPTIYNIFLRLGLVTDAGSGIPRVIAQLQRTTGILPDLKVEGNEFVISLHRPTFAS